MAVAVVTLSLARRAERFPDRTAAIDVSEERLYAPAETVHEDRVSYAALSRLAGRTAGALAERGVDPGDTVCLVTRNRVVSLAVLFACRRLGATFAPISHRLTPATVARSYEALEPSLVVAEAAQRDLVRSIPHDRSVTLADLAEDDASLDRDRTPETDAPLLALHGEPGRPVAVFSAETVEWNCIGAVLAWGLSRDDAGMVLDPLSSTDGLLRSALPLLYTGGTLLLDRAFDPGDALAAVETHDVTLVSGRATPIEGLAEADDGAALAGLERAVCDDAVAAGAVETLRERGVDVSTVYGILECPAVASRRADGEAAAGVVGRPALDCRTRLVDDDGGVLEGEATGRLRVAGRVVADGHAGAHETDSSGASRVESADRDDASADGGRYVDGWLDTGERFRRTAAGVYVRE